MESILGFMEEEGAYYETTSSCSSPYNFKLVPWLSWEEWLFVSEGLFSDSPDSVASALKRISAWRSRGCVPSVIEVTASIIEIQLKDTHIRKKNAVDNCEADRSGDSQPSEEMLAMLYCMAIMRLVNCVVEKTRKKNEVSIAEAADTIGIPRSLIDIRHEGSHRELPALQVVRIASIKALDWLKFYYWEPQKNAIPFQGIGSANLRNEIKSKFHELAFCLVKMAYHLRSSKDKEKRGYKKDITKIFKSLVGLYSSFSSEVVSVLLELLLNTKSSSDSSDLSVNTQNGTSLPMSLNEWKPVITKFSNKKPELYLALLKSVLDMMETQEGILGRGLNASSDCGPKICQVEHLSTLFTWLVRGFKGLKLPEKDSAAEVKVSSPEKTISKAVLMDALRKCLLVSASANSQLIDSALCLAKLTGDDHLVQKLDKLSFLVSSNLDAIKENASLASSNSMFLQHEKSISQAAKKLELIKRHRMKHEAVKGTITADIRSSKRWVTTKSWTQCPIGMLPCALGYSGRLPVLDYNFASEHDPEVPGECERWELNSCTARRRASSDIELLDNPCIKKKRKMVVDDCVSEMEDDLSSEDVNGQLMIGGVWKNVGAEEILAIKSAVRILV